LLALLFASGVITAVLAQVTLLAAIVISAAMTGRFAINWSSSVLSRSCDSWVSQVT
jgi:hypothetical protein